MTQHTFEEPPLEMGAMVRAGYRRDPKRLAFTMARYKFVAKMLEGKERVAELGCADAFGSRIVAQHVKYLRLYDSDVKWVDEAVRCGANEYAPVGVWDIVKSPLPLLGTHDAVYMLDVIEHVPSVDQLQMLHHVEDSLRNSGVFIVGTPSAESQLYASEISKRDHVCTYSYDGLRKFLQKRFDNVFMFGMNDEVLHTGFGPMCQYLFAVCVK